MALQSYESMLVWASFLENLNVRVNVECACVYALPFNIIQSRLVLFKSRSTSRPSGAPWFTSTVRWSLTPACPSLWPGPRMTSLSPWAGGNSTHWPWTPLVLLSCTCKVKTPTTKPCQCFNREKIIQATLSCNYSNSLWFPPKINGHRWNWS